MLPLRTHYSNLKISRDAPPEVVKAAYKALAFRWHPDRNPGNPDAGRIMLLINKSYAVLSDPEKRSEHDRWILLQELAHRSRAVPPPATPPLWQSPPDPRFGGYARRNASEPVSQQAAAAHYRAVAADEPQPPSPPMAGEPRATDLGRTLLALAGLLWLIWLLR